MTDKIKGFTVTLERDFNEDDVKVIMQAIQMIKGIAKVEPSLVKSDDVFNRNRIRYELRDKFYKFIKEEFD